MKVTRHDLTTYLVTSRSRKGIEHLVDLSDSTCSCEAALDFATTSPESPCAHVEAAIAFRAGLTITRNHGGSPLAFLCCRTA